MEWKTNIYGALNVAGKKHALNLLTKPARGGAHWHGQMHTLREWLWRDVGMTGVMLWQQLLHVKLEQDLVISARTFLCGKQRQLCCVLFSFYKPKKETLTCKDIVLS